MNQQQRASSEVPSQDGLNGLWTDKEMSVEAVIDEAPGVLRDATGAYFRGSLLQFRVPFWLPLKGSFFSTGQGRGPGFFF